MNVINFLHEHAFAEDRERIVVVFPKRVYVSACARFTSKLLEGGIMAVLFKMVNHPAADDPVDELKHLRRFDHRIGYCMQMVRHQDISVDSKPAGLSRFIEGFASNHFDCICAKGWQAVSGYGGDIESGSVSGDRLHEA